MTSYADIKTGDRCRLHNETEVRKIGLVIYRFNEDGIYSATIHLDDGRKVTLADIAELSLNPEASA